MGDEHVTYTVNSVRASDELYKQKSWLEFQYHNKKLSQSDIGKLFDVPQTTIKYWMDKLDIESRETYGLNHPPFDFNKAKELYKSGLGMRPVAEELGVCRESIKYWFNERGVEMKPPGNRKQTPERVERAVSMYEGGCTQIEIAEELSVGQTTVSKWLRDAGVDVRNQAGFGQVLETNAGTEVKSRLEQITGNWLEENNIGYEYEPNIDGTNYEPDFLVGDTIIEVWGIRESDLYDERREMKAQEYEELGYEIISVEPEYDTVSEQLEQQFAEVN